MLKPSEKPMLFLVFYYLLAAVMIFQGLHFYAEKSQPLGTVPEEVGQEPAVSERWGGYLVTYGALMAVCGFLSHRYVYFGTALKPLLSLGLLSMILFGAWVVFKGRTVEYLGTAAADEDHGHGHAHP
jgi:hypothetical protein